MPEEKKEEKKEDDKIILQVDMHCEGCKAKVRKALKEFKGVEGLDLNMQDQKVTIRGKLDAKQVYETVKKKTRKRTILIYPDAKKLAEDAEKVQKEEPKKEEPPPPDPEVVVVLKVNMHCGACAKQIKRSLLKMDGVIDVKEDFPKSIVTVRGKSIDPEKLCARVKKRSGKHCEIVPPPPPPPAPKEEPKQEEAKPAEEKKEEGKEEPKPAEGEAEGEKKEEKPAEEAAAAPAAEPEKKEEEKKDAAPAPAPAAEEKKEEKAPEEKPEEKKEEKKEEEKKEGGEETKTEVNKYEHIPYRSVPEYYVYPPQLFSDENPNACSIM